ncbi:MAG: Do family serine endopeptidase [Candidatus Omnitrophica bacterium]|nr:Do family serine endopeptidase [Candidatus Omnitrophota bacterium]
MRRRNYIILGVILCVIAGGLLSGAFKSSSGSSGGAYQSPYVFTAQDGELLTLQNAFVLVAKAVKPAVVQITTEKTVTLRYWDPFGGFEGFFNSPFEDFFGAPRRRQEEQPRTYERKQQGLGSGFIVDEAGHIITNNHVISGVDKILVKMQDDAHAYEAKVIGTDPKTDLALIKIEAKRPLPFTRLGDSDRIQPGEWVMAIGNPMGLTATVTVGIVSAKGRTGFGLMQYEDFIQTDAAINPGNSGGPLININAEVIGINTFIVSPQVAEGLGFAIPVNIAKQIFEQLKEKGRVVRGYLGVYLQPLDEELAESLGLKEVRGAFIAEVISGTAAEKAGLRAEDVILKFDGHDIKNTQDLQMRVANTPVGKKVSVAVWREKKEALLSMVISEMPSDEELAKAAKQEEELWRGMRVSSITPAIKERLGITDGEGVVVTFVEPGSPASEAGISAGAIIKKIDGKDAKNLAGYRNLVKAVPDGKNVRLLIKSGEQSISVILKSEK